ncbi:ABC transporter permease [Actinokineospora sp. G85]|uniref:ABC transporter permease n=1 Tax=Actinokineospora sp. G85 TaxID=3406626 RepID=UPI003C72ED2A
MRLVRDSGVAFAREFVPEVRAPVVLLFNATTPLLFIGLFGPLLVSSGMGEASSWQWFLPGILVLLALSGTAGSGATLVAEAKSGAFERMLVTPMNRQAILVGRTLKEVVTLVAQGVLLIALLLPTDFTVHPVGALAGLLLLAFFGLGVGVLSFTLALVSKRNENVFYGVQQMLFFPLLLLSGVLLPMDQAPGWLYTVSRFNPVSYVVEAERSLFAGQVLEWTTLWGVLVCAGLAATGLTLGTRTIRRTTA